MVHTKNNIFTYFSLQYLVLFSMVPRISGVRSGRSSYSAGWAVSVARSSACKIAPHTDASTQCGIVWWLIVPVVAIVPVLLAGAYHTGTMEGGTGTTVLYLQTCTYSSSMHYLVRTRYQVSLFVNSYLWEHTFEYRTHNTILLLISSLISVTYLVCTSIYQVRRLAYRGSNTIIYY